MLAVLGIHIIVAQSTDQFFNVIIIINRLHVTLRWTFGWNVNKKKSH